jgi:hypothetical protein
LRFVTLAFVLIPPTIPQPHRPSHRRTRGARAWSIPIILNWYPNLRQQERRKLEQETKNYISSEARAFKTSARNQDNYGFDPSGCRSKEGQVTQKMQAGFGVIDTKNLLASSLIKLLCVIRISAFRSGGSE